LAVWAVAVVAALVLVATALHGLTSNAHVVGTPESTKAAHAVAAAFPPTPADLKRQVSDVVVVSSSRYTVDSPLSRDLVARLVAKIRATGNVTNVRSYLDGNPELVSHDRHATLLQLEITSDSAAKPVVSVVQKADSAPFSVTITGDHSVGSDFNTLSQRDLEHGELFFGLPAALLVLVLVFGAVVAGFVPVLMALLSILVALGLVALLSLVFSLSVFIVNMLTGMGLALGIDYTLFVISRYREERTLGLQGGRDRSCGCDCEPGGALQRQRVRRRAAWDAARADNDHAQPGSRRDRRRRRLGRRGADAAAGALEPARRPGERAARPVRRAQHR
jgi:RND superfamily putative drug exporter